MTRNRLRKIVLISFLSITTFAVIATQAESLGCWWGGTEGGKSICPSDYKHANTNPRYKEYEPVPMTLKQAYDKGWREWMTPSGIIESLSSGSGPKYYDWAAKKKIGFFCPDSEGKPMRGHGAHNENPTTRYYSRIHLHPRHCPPDQYKYLKTGKWPTLYYYKCSGPDPDKLGATPYLKTNFSYWKGEKDIYETKMEGLCPLPRDEKPVCKPGHRMGYHFVQASGRRGFYRALDCRWDPNSDSGSDESGGGEQENCPTVKVKINGFPFQRIKVKGKKCS